MYGVFSPEGCVSSQHHSEHDAEARILVLLAEGEWSEEDHLEVFPTCDEHIEKKADACEDCLCANCGERAELHDGLCDDCADAELKDE